MERPADIGWKQFSIGLMDILRWPIAAIVIVLLLRAPLDRVLDAFATMLKS
ncbi:hypothetical protein SAMN05192583_3151 [Sphingomonas gellani]|uniref:Uncharacterized protein n=1 Tax=Sphingomonas gellani TaxID=1166340 RepID=A0A1H8HZM3_9SPHN|nr:hypothetical protein [Sphingomonas gellani]SEN61336.1 hypothetical protein SAMN05192583_3151 [Sphingomonas gellani]